MRRSNGEEILPEQPSQDSKSIPSNDLNKMLYVSIVPVNDPVARGNPQTVAISVTDQNSRPVANAQIRGILSYPGDNFEREFGGITHIQGKFVYSWTIGKKGDVGALTVQVEVSSPGLAVSRAVDSFDIVK